jgi:dihydroorotate dehydrogenase
MTYRLIRPLLFRLSPDRAHALANRLLRVLSLVRNPGDVPLTAGAGHELLGLKFPNPIGLAAGFDKSGRYIDDIAQLGFGFIEVGTVTPRPQPGNPLPNLFRLVEDHALINRMGFPNDGVEAAVRRLEKRRYRGICGVNIGKNFDTPLELASRDYLTCLRAVYATADYVTINISSPNTPGLRNLQEASSLQTLLDELASARENLAGVHGKRVPLLVKLAPDLDEASLEAICHVLASSGIDGVVATNTTTSRPVSLRSPRSTEAGGLSGAPLHPLSVHIIRRLRAQLGHAFPIIGVGGIASVETARATFEAGANLIQVYTGLIYEGPGLVGSLIRNHKTASSAAGRQ